MNEYITAYEVEKRAMEALGPEVLAKWLAEKNERYKRCIGLRKEMLSEQRRRGIDRELLEDLAMEQKEQM